MKKFIFVCGNKKEFEGGGSRPSQMVDELNRMGIKAEYRIEPENINDSDIVVITFPRKGILEKIPKDTFVIYDCMDDWEFLNSFNIDEDSVIKRANVITAVSLKLKVKISHYGRDAVYLPNASSNNIKSDTANDVIKGKITVGYVGYLNGSWIDWDLISYIANNNPDWAINLVGTCSKKVPSNIYLIGNRPHSEIYKYINSFDVCIIPFKVNEITESTSPIKAYEYLASYKPIVSTFIPEIVGFPYTFFAKNYIEFEDYIGYTSTLTVDTAKVFKFNKDNTWRDRVEKLLGLV